VRHLKSGAQDFETNFTGTQRRSAREEMLRWEPGAVGYVPHLGEDRDGRVQPTVGSGGTTSTRVLDGRNHFQGSVTLDDEGKKRSTPPTRATSR